MPCSRAPSRIRMLLRVTAFAWLCALVSVGAVASAGGAFCGRGLSDDAGAGRTCRCRAGAFGRARRYWWGGRWASSRFASCEAAVGAGGAHTVRCESKHPGLVALGAVGAVPLAFGISEVGGGVALLNGLSESGEAVTSTDLAGTLGGGSKRVISGLVSVGSGVGLSGVTVTKAADEC